MTTTTFVNGTPIVPSWLNDVNTLVYNNTGGTTGGFSSTSPGFGIDLVGGSQRVVSTIAQLKTVLKTGNGRVFVVGYYAAGDGGGGNYWYDSTDVISADNGGTIIVAADGGRWKLQTLGQVSLKQFGAKGDNVTVDTTFVQAAVTWVSSASTHSLWIPNGTYVINASITKASSFIGINMTGESLNAVFRFTTAAGFQLVGGSGGLCYGEIRGVQFIGINTTVCIELQGQCGQKVKSCWFDTCAIGGLLNNSLGGQFTEYCTFEDCNYTANCLLPLEYRRGAGADSFNGSGFRGICTINSSTSGVIAKVGLGCRPYNAPFFVQVWGNSSCTVIQNLNTAIQIQFYGQINCEVFSGTMTLGTAATGFEIPFVGKFTTNTVDTLKFGQLFLCDAAGLTASGGRQTLGGRYSSAQAVTTGANIVAGVPFSMNGSPVTYSVHIYGTNYDYRYEVKTYNNATSGLAPITATYSTFNTAGYGAPTFTINASKQLVVTNGAYPASGLTMVVDAVQMGTSMDYAFLGA